jgi:hypothetical protein
MESSTTIKMSLQDYFASDFLSFSFFFLIFVTMIIFIKAQVLGLLLGNTFAVTSSHNTMAKLNISAF